MRIWLLCSFGSRLEVSCGRVIGFWMSLEFDGVIFFGRENFFMVKRDNGCLLIFMGEGLDWI